MDLLLILTYAAFAYAAFRLFKIPVNGFTLLTAALGGIFLIGALLLGMNYNHPFTSQARFYFNTTPIVPGVSGVVTEVPVKANTPVKTGDVLFRIDPAPFENAVKAKEAALAAAVQTTHQLRATADAASMPLRPVMIFLHNEKPKFAAAFLQNSAQRIDEGSEAEFILPAVPGRFFKGKIVMGGAYIPQGQLQPSGNLVDPEQIKGEGRILVAIEPEEDLSKYLIVPGSSAQVAVYTHHMHHLAIMRKVLLRMKSWTNFIFGDGH